MKRKKTKFKPNRAFIKKEIIFYLANGGTITKLEFQENSFTNFWTNTSGQNEADEFLNGA